MEVSTIFLVLLVSTSISSLPDEAILINAGWNPFEGAMTSSEVLGSHCTVPLLPWDRSDHVTAITEDGTIITCGGESSDGTDDFSCLSLDLSTQSWTNHSTLDVPRVSPTMVSMPSGLFLLGGFKQPSVKFLPTGSNEWEEGPTIPGGEGAYEACSVAISDTQFLLIGGGETSLQVVEYDTSTGAWTAWPSLKQGRWGHACAKVGDTVVVTGGVANFFILGTTTVIDLLTKEQRRGGDIAPDGRAWHGMATLGGKLLAFGGMDRVLQRTSETRDSIEEWDEELEEWTMSDAKLETINKSMGFTSVPLTAICSEI